MQLLGLYTELRSLQDVIVSQGRFAQIMRKALTGPRREVSLVYQANCLICSGDLRGITAHNKRMKWMNMLTSKIQMNLLIFLAPPRPGTDGRVNYNYHMWGPAIPTKLTCHRHSDTHAK